MKPKKGGVASVPIRVSIGTDATPRLTGVDAREFLSPPAVNNPEALAAWLTFSS